MNIAGIGHEIVAGEY